MGKIVQIAEASVSTSRINKQEKKMRKSGNTVVGTECFRIAV